MTFLDVGLILASVVCVGGLFYRISRWNGCPVGEDDAAAPGFVRRSLFSLRALFVDVILLFRSLRTGPVRWGAHCLVLFGFMGLLLFHALDDTITARFFPAYEATLDPWFFLRNLFGFLVLIGLALMVFRRVRDGRLRLLTRFQDWAALFVVGGIILSGFVLESSKIVSPAVFDRMTDEFFYGEAIELTALKAFWAKEYGVVFPEGTRDTSDLVEQGAALNEDSCSGCHSDTASAFVSRPLATLLHPIVPAMNRSRADVVFWYLHILFCLVGLAALPFGKFLHPLATPANMLIRRGRRDGNPEPSMVKRGLGMDACNRCGECSLHCSVAPSFSVLGNPNILPSEKLLSLRRFETGRLSGDALKAFAKGNRICTECLRCTDICSAGINLQDLWIDAKRSAGTAAPDSNTTVRTMSVAERGRIGGDSLPPVYGLADNAESFHGCVQCTTCTSVCPVVAVSDDPSRDLDLLPQQIMNLLRMGLKNETLGARMVWSCTTCYKCQEHCPQNIRVADVLYELRNTVATRLRETDGGREERS